MDKEEKLTAKEAYEKTEQLLKAYSEGDLLGGNPMYYIQKYALQYHEEQSEKKSH